MDDDEYLLAFGRDVECAVMAHWVFSGLPELDGVRYVARRNGGPSRIFIRQKNGYTYRLTLEEVGTTIRDVFDWIDKKAKELKE